MIKSGDFTWNTLVNISTNEVEVKGLGAEFTVLPNASAFNSVQIVAKDGGSVEILGIPWLRDSITNRPVVDPNTGRRQAGEARTFGSVFP